MAQTQNKTNKNFPIIYLRRPLYMFEPDSLLENSQTLLMIYRRCRPCCIDDLIEGRQVRWGTTFPLSVIGLNHYNLGIDCDPKTKMEILANISLSLAFSFDYLDVLQCRRNDLCQVRRFDMSRWCDEKWWCQCVCHWASDRSKTASACFTHSLTLYDRQTLIIYYHLPCRTDAFSRWFTGLCMCLCMCVCVCDRPVPLVDRFGVHRAHTQSLLSITERTNKTWFTISAFDVYVSRCIPPQTSISHSFIHSFIRFVLV